MTQLLIKVLISSLLIVTAAEMGKKSTILAAILISLPLSSMIAISFLYYDTQDTEKVIGLAKGIVLMILPSMAFFGFLVLILKLKQPFWLAMLGSSLGMAGVFAVYAKILSHFGVEV